MQIYERLNLNNTVQAMYGVATEGSNIVYCLCGDRIYSLLASRRDATLILFGKNQSYVVLERSLKFRV